jgi:hypothetical protein
VDSFVIDATQSDEGGVQMLARIMIAVVAAGLALLGPVGGAIAADDTASSARDAPVALARDEDDGGVLATVEDDDDAGDGDGDDTDTATSGVDSNDGTNSGVSSVSRDTDLSRGDLTRDRTNDGPGGPTRDRTGGSTNDGSRHDTR